MVNETLPGLRENWKYLHSDNFIKFWVLTPATTALSRTTYPFRLCHTAKPHSGVSVSSQLTTYCSPGFARRSGRLASRSPWPSSAPCIASPAEASGYSFLVAACPSSSFPSSSWRYSQPPCESVMTEETPWVREKNNVGESGCMVLGGFLGGGFQESFGSTGSLIVRTNMKKTKDRYNSLILPKNCSFSAFINEFTRISWSKLLEKEAWKNNFANTQLHVYNKIDMYVGQLQ